MDLSFFGIGKPDIYIPRGVYEEILNHARESYPNECCGFLIGSIFNVKRVFESQRATNINTERANDRYIIDPKELNFVDKVARSQMMDIVGFYHSHPDHPDKPSATDREWGQPGYSYLIVSVKGGKDTTSRCWSFEKENEPFHEEKVKIEG